VCCKSPEYAKVLSKILFVCEGGLGKVCPDGSPFFHKNPARPMGQHKWSTEGRIDIGKSHQILPVLSVAFTHASNMETTSQVPLFRSLRLDGKWTTGRVRFRRAVNALSPALAASALALDGNVRNAIGSAPLSAFRAFVVRKTAQRMPDAEPRCGEKGD
jgi:hypothetical protein